MNREVQAAENVTCPDCPWVRGDTYQRDCCYPDCPAGEKGAKPPAVTPFHAHWSRPMKIELRPFTVPNYVIQVTGATRRQDGFREAPSYPLSEVDADTLARMCSDFRAAVFAKAGKADPGAAP